MKRARCLLTGLMCLAIGMGTTAIARQGAGDERWNSTPNDINNLLKTMKGRIEANYTMDIKTVNELNTDPDQNPIIYYSSHYNYEFSPEQREKLRKYMLGGGMMIFNTGLGSAPFYRSTRRELALIFPETPLQRLSSDHPIFHSFYDIDRVQYSPGVHATGFKGNEPWVDGITINCRTVAIVSRFGLAVAWDGGDVLPEYAAWMPESAEKMGANILAYATATRAWAKQAAGQMQFVDRDKSSTGKMAMVQVMYDGVWKTRHAGLPFLLQKFNLKTGIPVKFGLKEMKLSNPGIFSAPLLYMTGHENFDLDSKEALNLKKYIEAGGFLFAEACCGRKGFDLSFRRLMRQLFPSAPLTAISEPSILYANPNRIVKVGVTPQLAAQVGKAVAAPRLEGIDIDGHYGVVYSKFGLAGGWELSQNPYALGYDETGSIRLGQNILMYAITQ